MAIDLTDWQKTFAKIMQDTYEGKIKPGELSQTDIMDTYNKVSDGAAKGYGKGWNGSSSTIDPKVLQMKRNLYKFSCAKDGAMLQALNNAMYRNGKLIPYEEFRGEAMKLGHQFKENWMEAEYRTARQSGIMAQKWNDIQANKKLFPNLKYRTQHDDRVRPEHAALDGIIAPIDSDFWKKYYPPNGWRCRCDAVQTAEPASIHISENYPDVKPEFEINVGESGQVFNEDPTTGHSYFALAKNDPNWQTRFELSKLEAGFETINTPGGNTIDVSIYADDSDLKDNLKSGAKAVDVLDIEVKIRPHLGNGWKNPEYVLDGAIADRCAGDFIWGYRDKKNQIKTFIKQYNQQFPDKPLDDKYAIFFDITGMPPFDYDVLNFLNGKLRVASKLQFFIIENGDQIVKLEKKDSKADLVAKLKLVGVVK